MSEPTLQEIYNRIVSLENDAHDLRKEFEYKMELRGIHIDNTLSNHEKDIQLHRRMLFSTVTVITLAVLYAIVNLVIKQGV